MFKRKINIGWVFGDLLGYALLGAAVFTFVALGPILIVALWG